MTAPLYSHACDVRGHELGPIMTLDSEYRAVLGAYPRECRPSRAVALGGGGGFSGAMLWRLETPAGMLCLRRWPREHPSVERLQFIHAVLWHVRQEGFRLAPVPIESRNLVGFVEQHGRLWELCPWMPGEPLAELPPPVELLQAAMQALAEFHVAASTFPLDERARRPSPGLASRRGQLRELIDGGLSRLTYAVAAAPRDALALLAGEALALAPELAARLAPELARGAVRPVGLIPCLRDVWSAHVLFQDGQVSGVIDFGAMRVDSVAGDVARLLSSYVGGNRGRLWQAGIDAYEGIRPLDDSERALVDVFDSSGVLLGAMNWIDWLYVAHRTFTDLPAVENRLRQLVARMGSLPANG